MDDREVEEGDWCGVSLGEPAAVEGDDSAVVEVMVRRRAAGFGKAVEAIVYRILLKETRL
jgi:hypothetical protein